MMGQSGYPLHYYSVDQTESQKIEREAPLQSDLGQFMALHELPPDVDDFVGRSAEIQQVLALMNQSVQDTQPTTVVICLTGPAGVGKSALALHLAHRFRSSFLDAQFYVNLRGTDQQTHSPDQVITNLLRAWGVAENAATSPLDRADLFQATFTNKHVILVLDNAEDESQVRPLIPVHAAGLVLITSRQPLGMEESTDLELATLSQSEAIELLHKLVNRDVIHLTMDLAKQIVELCHCLPLAIRLTAGTIKNQSLKTLTNYVEQLHQEHQRLAPLRLSYAEVRPSFALSYQQLQPKAAQLLRLLGLLTDSHFTLSLSAALLETSLDDAGQLLGRLVDLKLIKRIGGGHYCVVHDGVRLLARGQLATEETAETRQAARLRMSQWYLKTCTLMNLVLQAQGRSRWTPTSSPIRRQLGKTEQQVIDSALNWFERERLSILTAIDWAVQAEIWEMVIAFAQTLAIFFELHSHSSDSEHTHRLALEAARRLTDPLAEAELLNNLGNAYLRQAKFDRAETCYKQSSAMFQEAGITSQTAKTLTNLGVLYLHQRRTQLTLTVWREALGYVPVESEEYQYLTQWMQNVDAALWQLLHTEISVSPPPRGLFQSMGEVIRRFLTEDRSGLQ